MQEGAQMAVEYAREHPDQAKDALGFAASHSEQNAASSTVLMCELFPWLIRIARRARINANIGNGHGKLGPREGMQEMLKHKCSFGSLRPRFEPRLSKRSTSLSPLWASQLFRSSHPLFYFIIMRVCPPIQFTSPFSVASDSPFARNGFYENCGVSIHSTNGPSSPPSANAAL
jgi:hypothetical protein